MWKKYGIRSNLQNLFGLNQAAFHLEAAGLTEQNAYWNYSTSWGIITLCIRVLSSMLQVSVLNQWSKDAISSTARSEHQRIEVEVTLNNPTTEFFIPVPTILGSKKHQVFLSGSMVRGPLYWKLRLAPDYSELKLFNHHGEKSGCLGWLILVHCYKMRKRKAGLKLKNFLIFL